MKKLLCFILVVIMVAGINVNVFANTADNNQESGITLYTKTVVQMELTRNMMILN